MCTFQGVSDHDLLFSRQAKDEAPSAEEGRSIIQELEGEQLVISLELCLKI